MSIFLQQRFLFPASWNKVFIITLFFVTLASGLFWLDFFREYEAETDVLVIGKPASINSGQVAGNLAALARTLSFSDRVFASDDALEDAAMGYAPDKRKALWQEMVSVTRDDESGMLVISARGASPEEARLLAKQTAQTLFAVAGLYYNVKTDIDLRIVDGPIVATTLRAPLWYAAASFATGLLATSLFFLVLRMLPDIFAVRSKEEKSSRAFFEKRTDSGEKEYPVYALGETVPFIDPRKFIPSKPSALSFETPQKEQETALQARVASVKAKAPANLPVAEDESFSLPVAERDLPFDFEEMFPEKQEEVSFPTRGEHEIIKEPRAAEKKADESVVLPEPKKGEPTVEDYKRRLNELLAGGK